MREGGYDSTRFQIDWDKKIAICPEGKQSAHWYEHQEGGRYPRSAMLIKFKVKDCRDCLSRTKCVRNKMGHARHLHLPPRALYEAQKTMTEVLSPIKDAGNIKIAPASRGRSRKECGAVVCGEQDTTDCRKRIFRKLLQQQALISCER